MEDLPITKECCDWLAPIVKDLPDSCYESSAVDAVLNHVMKLEKEIIKLRNKASNEERIRMDYVNRAVKAQ